MKRRKGERDIDANYRRLSFCQLVKSKFVGWFLWSVNWLTIGQLCFVKLLTFLEERSLEEYSLAERNLKFPLSSDFSWVMPCGWDGDELNCCCCSCYCYWIKWKSSFGIYLTEDAEFPDGMTKDEEEEMKAEVAMLLLLFGCIRYPFCILFYCSF